MWPFTLTLYFYASWYFVWLFFYITMLLSCVAWLILFILWFWFFYYTFDGPKTTSLYFWGDVAFLCWGGCVCRSAGLWDVSIFGGGWTAETVLTYFGYEFDIILSISFFKAGRRLFAFVLSCRFFLKQETSIFLISSLLICLIFPFIRLVTISVYVKFLSGVSPTSISYSIIPIAHISLLFEYWFYL